MALFKIFKGPQNNLGTAASGTNAAHEGYAYFTTDSGKFYIDIADAATAQIGVNRIPLSADKADKDDLGNIIKNTYAASLNLAGHTLKLIAKDGTSVLSTITLPDEDTKVTQKIKSDNHDYRVILSYEANDTDNVTNTVNKASNLRYNPSLNKLSTGNIALTGTLAVTGAATFADNATVTGQLTSGSLLVNGNSSFVNDVAFTKSPTAPTPAKATNDTTVATTAFVKTIAGDYLPLAGGTLTGQLKWTSNSLPSVTSADYFLVIDAFANGGATKYIGKANAIKTMVGSSAIGSSTKPIYWTGSAFSAITSYSGAAALTGTPTAPTAAAGTNTTQIATTEFVTNAVAQGFVANDAMVFKGLIGSNQTITQLPASGYNAGWTYRVADAGTFAGEYCEVGDLLIAINDGPASGNSVINADWGKVEHNIDGAVFRGAGASNSSVGSSTQPVYVNASGIVNAINYTIDKSVPSNAVFTDRYVNSATFADDSTNTAASPVKMTLTRAGSDTATVTANIPKVSSSSAGVAPKGAAVSSQSQTTKFLREDGTWAAPSYTTNTNTTYTFAEGSTNGAFSVTPSGGSAQSVPIHGLGTAAYKAEDYYVKRSGDTMSGSLQVINTANNTAGLKIALETQSYNFGFHMGTGGVNHGLYDFKASKWVILGDASHNWIFNGNLNGKLTTARKLKVNLEATADVSFDGSADVLNIPTTGNLSTQRLARPRGLRGVNDVTLQALINSARANRLAFLPADQIIIEKTTDGGTTWVDAGVSDSQKLALFSEQRPNISIPTLNGVRNQLCGLRITITAMKYNVPAGTPETEKYNYWNSTYVQSQERYCQLKDMYFWLSAVNDSIGVMVQRATGANSTSWSTIFNDDSYFMTGWSGCDYINFSQNTFGGGSTQTSNYWNYRIILMTKGVNGTTTMATSSTTSAQSIMEIRAYGDTVWGVANRYMAYDHMYSFDANKNVTFPKQVTATKFIGALQGNADTATSAGKLQNTTKIGDTNKPVYFTASGVPAAINYTIDKSVPSNAVFTDTTYTFANGTDGSFSVTPSGGSAQTVSIGKPATAGTADVANSVAWGNVTGKPSAYYTLPTAADSTLGGIKTGYSASGKNYAIKVDSNGNAYVNVPWTDNNTTSFTITANATDGLWDLTGTNGTNAVTYALAPYSTKQSSTSFYTAATNPTLTTRLNYDGYFYATKLYSGGAEVLTSHQSLANYKTKQTAVSDPAASNTAIAFIDSISQDTNGVITPTKKTVRSASTSQTGVVQLSSATNSTSETLAATAKAVKTAYDLANTANTTANNHKYWANVESTSAAAYNKAPEVASVKINGDTSASAASTKNVELVYDATLEVLNFVFS